MAIVSVAATAGMLLSVFAPLLTILFWKKDKTKALTTAQKVCLLASFVLFQVSVLGGGMYVSFTGIKQWALWQIILCDLGGTATLAATMWHVYVRTSNDAAATRFAPVHFGVALAGILLALGVTL